MVSPFEDCGQLSERAQMNIWESAPNPSQSLKLKLSILKKAKILYVVSSGHWTVGGAESQKDNV